MKIAAIGGGSWGTTVAHLCAHNTPTVLWARRDEVVSGIRDEHENPRYLSGFRLHDELTASGDIEEVVDDADVVIIGVASAGFESTLNALSSCVRNGTPIVSLAKGLERDTGQRMSELICEQFPDNPVGVLTGPNLAKEILAGQAAASVIAFDDPEISRRLQPVFTTDLFRVYTNPDLVGCELGGALKNVIAVAAGMADGLGAGDNTRAAVITRGLAELTRLGVAMGGRPETFGGLTGMGDLIATCISPQSRNRTVGEQLGKGRALDEIIEEMQQVAEGIKSAPVVARLGREHGVELPICNEICAVVEEGRSAAEVYRGLLQRPHQGEVVRR
ncbi:MAG: glycerol-3-phosphate dehydrogenase (NAD(P)+) [Verrucomicrobiales bacterium]|jgi:glycerol-3-phosphate dehydrogenase (NAD(P)+)